MFLEHIYSNSIYLYVEQVSPQLTHSILIQLVCNMTTSGRLDN